MATIRIVNPVLFTTVQDLGRYGFQQYGMPVTGAMDSHSLKLANLLVGNQPEEACLESTFTGPEIEILKDTITAVTGGKSSLAINDKQVSINCNHRLKAGDIIKIGSVTKGCRVYIAFAGGIDVPLVMNSRSTYLRGNIGGYKGRALKTGDELNVGPSSLKFKPQSIPPEVLLNLAGEQNLRVIGGSEINYFSFEGVKTFLTSTFTISHKSDRMGYRLTGTKIEHKEGADIISSGICNGAIQVPGDGQPIIMLADRQTVGGYTKIANVITADLPLLGQMKPGDKINFTQLHLDQAHQVLKEQEEKLNRLKQKHT
jgi:biotin-dependent carboxylase-like uncharacterized protein